VGRLCIGCLLLLFWFGFVVLFGATSMRWFEESATLLCNGEATLCDRTVNGTIFLTTHNSYSSVNNCVSRGQVNANCNTSDSNFIAPNNYWNTIMQLDHGARALQIDLYSYKKELYLCHTSCILGKVLFATWLTELQQWLNANPREVVVVFIEQYVPNRHAVLAIEQAGLANHTYAHSSTTKRWPTLSQLIDSKQRLMFFRQDHSVRVTGIADAGYKVPLWYMDEWEFVQQTEYANQIVAHLVNNQSCKPVFERPKRAAGTLLILNNYLTNPIALPSLASQVNRDDFIVSRVMRCVEDEGHLPNFISVDFPSIGSAQEAVHKLNVMQAFRL